ncbi:hypothetical protein MCHI_000574 [Candidatus Magnetoovum chiemensis]|nr:hypothetical protein MCHI_000574 [Candidatus Magnetoovum chiemensis]
MKREIKKRLLKKIQIVSKIKLVYLQNFLIGLPKVLKKQWKKALYADELKNNDCQAGS